MPGRHSMPTEVTLEFFFLDGHDLEVVKKALALELAKPVGKRVNVAKLERTIKDASSFIDGLPYRVNDTQYVDTHIKWRLSKSLMVENQTDLAQYFEGNKIKEVFCPPKGYVPEGGYHEALFYLVVKKVDPAPRHGITPQKITVTLASSDIHVVEGGGVYLHRRIGGCGCHRQLSLAAKQAVLSLGWQLERIN
jgi:hypothetical protein